MSKMMQMLEIYTARRFAAKSHVLTMKMPPGNAFDRKLP